MNMCKKISLILSLLLLLPAAQVCVAAARGDAEPVPLTNVTATRVTQGKERAGDSGVIKDDGTALDVACLRVPAFTAYLDPAAGGARVGNDGIQDWKDPAVKVLWAGAFRAPGRIDCSLALRLPAGAASRLRMTLAGKAREAEAKGDGTNTVVLTFGSFDIPAAGYQRIVLESLNEKGTSAGQLEALILAGPAASGAHFNMKPRRNAASVHLSYASTKDTPVAAFYCEVTGVDDPLWTYYMACGWHRGYLGMQVNRPTERRIIFSVWDSGGEANDRKRVAQPDRVQLVAKGEGVVADDFGGEGTGGHSHLVYPWKTGEKQRFLVTAKPADPTHTVYSGFYFHPEQRKWMLISSWRTPKEGGYMRGLYSFSENFGESNGHLRRKALFGNQWIRSDTGRWIEVTEARFSHDETGKSDRLDRFMGVEGGQFFLSQGGFVDGYTEYGKTFQRPPVGKALADDGIAP